MISSKDIRTSDLPDARSRSRSGEYLLTLPISWRAGSQHNSPFVCLAMDRPVLKILPSNCRVVRASVTEEGYCEAGR